MAFPKRKKKVVEPQLPFWASSPEQLVKHVPQKTAGKKRVSSIKSEVDGIKFDSQLEVYCYKALNNTDLSFEYGQKTFTIVEGFKYIGDSYESDKRKGTGMYPKSNNLQSVKYTPDFIGNGWIIETKGRQNESFPMRWKLFKKYLNDNNLKYDLYMPHNHKQVDECIQMILTK